MATKKISELEAINAAEDNDVLVIVDTSESTTNKITKGNLLIGAGHTIQMTLNENYQIVLVLKNAAGTALSTQTIDLPNENAITNLTYNNGILTVTKQSGATSEVDISPLIEGLVTESDFNTFKEALQTILEAINEKDTEQDEAIAENYKVINKLNEKLEDQQKVISQLPQVTGQGTEITLENTIEAQFTKFDVEGNSTQETTVGKQLIGIADGTYTSTNNAGSITFKDGIGKVTIASGTSSSFGMNIPLIKPVILKANQSYTRCNNSGNAYPYIALYDSEKATIDSMSASDNGLKVYTPTEDKEVHYIFLWFSIQTYGDIKPMMVEGSYTSITMPEFEKFTFGASPNPNYEQPIESAGDNGSINEKIQNKNLFDKNNANILNAYIDYTNNLIKTADSTRLVYIKCQPNTTYTISKIQSSRFIVATSNTIPQNNTSLIDKNQNNSATNLSITTSATAKYLCVFFYHASYDTTITEQQIINSIQIEKGTTATPFVEHKEQNYSIPVQQPFRSIGDVRDVFFKNTVDSPYYDENLTLNGWYERHYIGEYIANNDLPGNGMTDTLIGLLTPILNIAPGLTGINFTSIVRSNLLQNTIINNSGLGGTNGDSRIRVNLSKDFAKTFDEANAFLTNNKFKIEFVQKEPLNLPCTETQIQQLENKPSTYKEMTIINSEDETEGYLEVSGIYDLNKLITRTEVLESES